MPGHDRDLTVAGGLAEGDPAHRLQGLAREPPRQPPIEGHIERHPVSREVLVELCGETLCGIREPGLRLDAQCVRESSQFGARIVIHGVAGDHGFGGAHDEDVPEGSGVQNIGRGDGCRRHVSILFVGAGSAAAGIAAVDSLAIGAAGEEALTDSACRAILQHSWGVTGGYPERNLV